jgi:uncharacterized protein YjbI with pentapeptide repeats
MVTTLKEMSGEEFVKKLLSGERDFSGVKLEQGFDLGGCEGFGEVQAYLKGQRLRDSPVIISGSDFSYIKAAGLYLPFVRAQRANLYGSFLKGADLSKADLREAYLERANLREAHLREADLEGANLFVAYLGETNLEGANLKGIKGLEDSVNLHLAVFNETKVTLKEKAVIENVLANKKLFEVEQGID